MTGTETEVWLISYSTYLLVSLYQSHWYILDACKTSLVGLAGSSEAKDSFTFNAEMDTAVEVDGREGAAYLFCHRFRPLLYDICSPIISVREHALGTKNFYFSLEAGQMAFP